MTKKEKIKILNRISAQRMYRFILNESRKRSRFCLYCNKTKSMTNEEFGTHIMNCEEDFIVSYAKNNFIPLTLKHSDFDL